MTSCDYGGCDQEAVGGFHAHGVDVDFCEFHLERINP